MVSQSRSFLNHEFEQAQRVGDAREEVQSGGDVQVGCEAEIDYRNAAIGGEGGILNRLRQPDSLNRTRRFACFLDFSLR